MLASCGNSVQPAAEADERAGGPVDVPDAVQQPPPAAQRPGVGQVGDRLFHQRAQPCLQAVERPLLLGELVFGAAVTDRGMPVLARLGQAAEPAVQQAGDLDLVQRVVEPRQLDELLLVAAARPATVAPQQVTPDRAHRQTLSGVGVALAVVQDFWLAHPHGRCTRVANPSTQTASPAWAISASSSRSWSRLVMKLPSGWQYPTAASGPSSRSRLSPTSVLEIPTARPARRYDSPSRMTAGRRPGGPPALVAGCRPGRAGVVEAGGRGDRPARPARVRAARSAGSMTRGPDLRAGVSTLPMVWSPSMSGRTGHHGHPQ